MEWTDQRMDDLAQRMDAGFARVDADIRELRGDVKDLRAEMHRGDGLLRVEMNDGFRAVHADIGALRATAVRFGMAIVVAMAGMIAALIGVAVTGSPAA